MLQPLEWDPSEFCLSVLDQRCLPAETRWLNCYKAEEVAQAIAEMAVRGAPAIGIAGAWGAVLALRHEADAEASLARLAAARPTAVNLRWAIDRMRAIQAQFNPGPERLEAVIREAEQIQAQDLAANQAIGAHGARLLPKGSRVLTHCNTGALATGGHGTALGIIRTAWSQGLLAQVYATETRPWLQGSRLTAWELSQEGIPGTLIVDSAAAALMGSGAVDAVVIGADRITRRGDVANKIGSYMLAVLARAHDIPFIVAAPQSTVDRERLDGKSIPIEDRPSNELWRAAGLTSPLPGIKTHNPAFDITPAHLISAIVTEKGVACPMENKGLEKLF